MDSPREKSNRSSFSSNLSTPSGRSSRSQSRGLPPSPCSPCSVLLEDIFPSFVSTPSPGHDETQQSSDAFWSQGPPSYAAASATPAAAAATAATEPEPEPRKPIKITIKKKEANSEPPAIISQLIQDYTSLMMSRGTMDSRRFNRLSMQLLDKCITSLRSMKGDANVAAAVQSEPTFLKYREDAREAFGEFRRLLLNEKEMHSETLVEKVVSFIDKGLSPMLTADERKEELQKKVWPSLLN